MVGLEAVSYILISIIRTCYCYDKYVQKALVRCSGKNPGLNCDLNYDNVSIFQIIDGRLLPTEGPPIVTEGDSLLTEGTPIPTKGPLMPTEGLLYL